MNKEKNLIIDDLPPMHDDTYFFGYGIDVKKPYEMANQIIKLKQEKEDLIKWLEEMIAWTAKKANINEKWQQEYAEHQKICWWINHARMDILDRIKDSNYE